jgi:hypothetical protein
MIENQVVTFTQALRDSDSDHDSQFRLEVRFTGKFEIMILTRN